MITLQCKRCNNTWTYDGSNLYCANCIQCKSTVFLNKSNIDNKVINNSSSLEKNKIELEAMQQG